MNPRTKLLSVKSGVAAILGAAVALFLTAIVEPSDAFASEGVGGMQTTLIGLVLILLAAKLGGDIMNRIGQPSALGELIFGILLGNVALLGWDYLEPLKTSSTLEALAELGVLFLLFDVGLQTSLGEMLRVGVRAFAVASAGVVAPFFLGWGASAYLWPDATPYKHVFIGAALCATSVGITARVLKDIGRENTTEAKIILGAAVIDDILGLIVLATVVGLIDAANQGTTLGLSTVASVSAKACGFVTVTIVAGSWATRYLFNVAQRFRGTGILLTVALLMCFTLSWLASEFGLAPIVGAFCAGMLIEEKHYARSERFGKYRLPELIAPLVTFLAPLFFVRMGMMVDLRIFTNPRSVLLAGVLVVAAVVGKQVCGLFSGRGTNRLAVGIGMIPRGEVGLIFAGIGAKLVLDGTPVLSSDAYSAVIMMVIVTTLMTPPLLQWSLTRKSVNMTESA